MLDTEWWVVKPFLKNAIFFWETHFQTGPQGIGIHKFRHPDTAPSDLVFVGRANSFSGGSNLFATQSIFSAPSRRYW